MPVWMRLKRERERREWVLSNEIIAQPPTSMCCTSTIVLWFLFISHESYNAAEHSYHAPVRISCLNAWMYSYEQPLFPSKHPGLHGITYNVKFYSLAQLCSLEHPTPDLNVECRVNVLTDHHNYSKHFRQIFVSFRLGTQVMLISLALQVQCDRT